jgi:predicted DNA-binding transcriptional regulator AlpA
LFNQLSENAMTPKMLPFAEGLKLLGVSRSTAYERMNDPDSDFLRPFRNGGRLWYLERDIIAWLEAKASAAQTPNSQVPATFRPTNATVAAELAEMLAATLRRAGMTG